MYLTPPLVNLTNTSVGCNSLIYPLTYRMMLFINTYMVCTIRFNQCNFKLGAKIVDGILIIILKLCKSSFPAQPTNQMSSGLLINSWTEKNESSSNVSNGVRLLHWYS